MPVRFWLGMKSVRRKAARCGAGGENAKADFASLCKQYFHFVFLFLIGYYMMRLFQSNSGN
jgi:hypothetical protein